MADDEALRRTARGILWDYNTHAISTCESKTIPSSSISEFLARNVQKTEDKNQGGRT